MSSSSSAPGAREVERLEGSTLSWGAVTGSLVLSRPVPENLVSNVHALPQLDGLAVLSRTEGRGWEVPGGTREQGESVSACIQRELREEVGGVMTSFRPIAWLDCESSAAAPYRPHIPHPSFAILLGVAELSSILSPTGWGAEELHCEASIMPLDEAVRRLRRTPGQELFAELYEVALRTGTTEVG